MSTGDAPATSSFASTNPTPALPSQTRNTPSHLQDLVAEDLPDASRGIITSEIALFRERGAQRAAVKKEQDLAAEMRRHAPPSEMSRPQQGNAWGPRGGQQDPQSYNKPIGFVGAGTAVGAAKEAEARPSPPPVDEAQQERERAQRAQRDAEALFRDVSRFGLVRCEGWGLMDSCSASDGMRRGSERGSKASNVSGGGSAFRRTRRIGTEWRCGNS